MNSESEYPKTIVTAELGNKADTQRPKYEQGDVKEETYISRYVSMPSKAPGGLDSSKVRINGKQERLKDWGSSPTKSIAGVVTRKETTQSQGCEKKQKPICNG